MTNAPAASFPDAVPPPPTARPAPAELDLRPAEGGTTATIAVPGGPDALAPDGEGLDGPLAAALTATVAGTALWALLFLSLAALCVALRTSLLRALPAEVQRGPAPGAPRTRLERLLSQAEVLAASASLIEIACEIVFVALVVTLVAGDAAATWLDVALALLVAAPLILLVGEWLPAAIARTRSGWVLAHLLPPFAVLQKPVELVVHLLQATRQVLLRGLGLRDASPDARQLVEGFRAMVESEELGGHLEEGTKELLANVMEFRAVDAAEVMTPRTAIVAVPATSSLREALAVCAEAGVSRVPVYDTTIDSVIGTLSALEVAKAIVAGKLDETRVRDVMRPPMLVPETKLVAELLAEFRRKKQKMAIVVDEYGGTAGIVTLADLVTELVGEIPDEHVDENARFHRREDGTIEVQAALHVSDVNEELGLDLPEEADFETLGGFVLAEFGRFPREGEVFRHNDIEFAVLEANDRRVIKVGIRQPA